MESNSEVGKRIKELRIQKGMTLEELGQKVGATKSMIRKYEEGITPNIKMERLVDIAHALDVHPGYLFGDFPLEEARRMHEDFVVFHQEERRPIKELMVELAKMDDDQIRRLTAFVKGMKNI